MALLYKMRALAVSDNSCIWTDSEPDIDGSNAPEAVVIDTISIDSVGGTSGTSTAQLHDTTHSPAGLWQFNENFVDSSGNGFNLSSNDGSINRFIELYGIKFAFFEGDTDLTRPGYDAALNITGALTVEFFILSFGGGVLVSFIGSGETESTNSIYAISQNNFFSETGVGTNHEQSTGFSPLNSVYHNVIIRENDDSLTQYVNGQHVFSGGSVPSSGGTSAKFYIGSNGPGDSYCNCLLSSVKVIDGALSANDVKEEYNRTLGPVLGII